jgi:hypothetical protein
MEVVVMEQVNLVQPHQQELLTQEVEVVQVMVLVTVVITLVQLVVQE